MKRIVLLLVFQMSVAPVIFGQTATKVEVLDTRSTNEPPTFYNREAKFEFKNRNTVGAPGTGIYSGLLTFAPWGDNSGQNHHQLNFNDGGLFYRSGLPNNTSWNNWVRVLTTETDESLFLSGVLSVNTNSDAVLTFNNTDDSWQYFQFKQSGTRKTWLGLHSGGDFCINKENGGDIVLNGANVGIGTYSPKSKLAVEGQIRATEVKVLADISVPDYVFEPDYELRTLKETKEYIEENKHLPEIPSAREIGENGIDIGDMNMRLLKKIEELTLYQIELLERLEKAEQEISQLKNK
ncbi:hypothetical protein QQ020_14495 [Fulvivirgaceae bacterium BMA12]|uniref:Uncharacterized protein n=1 Tax=Agaribacillus aureus TaxID=3051825 RepID=A0ABT8L922_9BACT|nr:hypothetical protein [Fulvivirgaceae bacterium BMA12]